MHTVPLRSAVAGRIAGRFAAGPERRRGPRASRSARQLEETRGDPHPAPTRGSRLHAGRLDAVIVTTFTAGTQETLPIWILNNLRLPNQRPIVNVVAVFLVLLSLLPLYLAQRLTRDGSAAGGRV